MATGSITTLGIGSGLDLQNILDQLKEAEQAPITTKEEEKTALQKEVSAYNSINTMLYAMKSDALSLSLESDFLKNTVSVSDDDILTASANDGIAESSHSIEVVQKAQYSSWQTDGVESSSSVIYAPPQSGIASPVESVVTGSETLTIKYGALEDQISINIDLTSGMNLSQIIDTINSSENNKDADGNQLAMASIGSYSGSYYIRVAAFSGGDSAESQVSVEGFDYIMADTTVSIATGSDDPMYLSVAPGTTYEQFASNVNDAGDNPGITAMMVNTGEASNPYRLTLTSNNTGESNRISVQNIPMEEVTGTDGESLNAIFKVNGVEYQRQSNTGITDVISGVTLNFKKAGEVSIGVQKDLDPVKENIISLINGFNDLVEEINGSDSSGGTDTANEDEDNPLSDSFEVKRLLSSMKTLLSTSVTTDSEYISLVDLGLEINQDGSVTLDETALEEAIASDPEAVQSLFIGDEDSGITGLGDIINDGLTNMLSSQGLVSTEIDAAETRISRLDEDILAATERLDKRYEILTADFVRLDTYISELNSEAAYLQSIIDSYNATMENT